MYLTSPIHLPTTLTASALFQLTFLLLHSVLTGTAQSSCIQADLYVPACLVKTSEDTEALFRIGHRQGEIYTEDKK